MIDQGALGTLLIGLNAIRAETQNPRRRASVAVSRQEHAGIRVALARALRRAAELLERPTIGEVAR